MAGSGLALDVRVRKLEAAMDRAVMWPEPVVSSVPMAKDLLGVSWPVLRDWCNELPGFDTSGAFVRGAQGNKWEFRPAATVWFLLRHFRAQHEAAVAKSRRDKEIAGGRALASVPDGFDLDQTRKLVALSGDVQEQRERQGELVEVTPIAGLLKRVFSEIQVAILTTPQEMDPTGRLPTETRELLDDAARKSALRAQRAGREALTKIDADVPEPRKSAARG